MCANWLCAGRIGLGWVHDEFSIAFHMFMHSPCIRTLNSIYFDIFELLEIFQIVSLSLSLYFLFTLVMSMAPKCKSTLSRNPFYSGASSSSDPTPSHLRFHDEDARKAFSENFSRRGIHSERQVILAYPLKVLFLSIISTHWGEGFVHIRVTGSLISSTLNGQTDNIFYGKPVLNPYWPSSDHQRT